MIDWVTRIIMDFMHNCNFSLTRILHYLFSRIFHYPFSRIFGSCSVGCIFLRLLKNCGFSLFTRACPGSLNSCSWLHSSPHCGLLTILLQQSDLKDNIVFLILTFYWLRTVHHKLFHHSIKRCPCLTTDQIWNHHNRSHGYFSEDLLPIFFHFRSFQQKLYSHFHHRWPHFHPCSLL